MTRVTRRDPAIAPRETSRRIAININYWLGVKATDQQDLDCSLAGVNTYIQQYIYTVADPVAQSQEAR